MERKAKLGIMGWHGTIWTDVIVTDETPKRYRIKAINKTSLAGSRMINQGETALVPKHAVRFTD